MTRSAATASSPLQLGQLGLLALLRLRATAAAARATAAAAAWTAILSASMISSADPWARSSASLCWASRGPWWPAVGARSAAEPADDSVRVTARRFVLPAEMLMLLMGSRPLGAVADLVLRIGDAWCDLSRRRRLTLETRHGRLTPTGPRTTPQR